jgi:hypothetical protein
MTKRILLAGFLGAIAMFIWSSIAHVVLPLGQAGFKEIPNEPPVLSAMQAQLGQNAGLYFFPGIGVPQGASREQRDAAMKAYDQKLATNPSGLLVYNPAGSTGVTPGKLATEFGTEFVEALLLAFLLAQISGAGFGSRMGCVVAIALVGVVTTNIPYWNWYGFPLAYEIPYAFIQIVDYVVAGMVVIAILKKQAPQFAAARA